jgi:hypothetical protein
LQRAHQIDSDETGTLDFQSYDTTNGVKLIEVWAADRQLDIQCQPWRGDFAVIRGHC